MVAANDKTAIIFSLSGGEKHDAPEGRKLIEKLEKPEETCSLAMDRAYEDDETRALAVKKGYDPVVPPKKTDLSLGNMIGNCINAGMKLRGCSGAYSYFVRSTSKRIS